MGDDDADHPHPADPVAGQELPLPGGRPGRWIGGRCRCRRRRRRGRRGEQIDRFVGDEHLVNVVGTATVGAQPGRVESRPHRARVDVAGRTTRLASSAMRSGNSSASSPPPRWDLPWRSRARPAMPPARRPPARSRTPGRRAVWRPVVIRIGPCHRARGEPGRPAEPTPASVILPADEPALGDPGGDPLRWARDAPAGAHGVDPQAAGRDRRPADRLARDPDLRRPGLHGLRPGHRLPGRADRGVRRRARLAARRARRVRRHRPRHPDRRADPRAARAAWAPAASARPTPTAWPTSDLDGADGPPRGGRRRWPR